MLVAGLKMGGAAGETEEAGLRVDFDRRLKLEVHGSKITSDDGLLAFRELDDAMGLSDLAKEVLVRLTNVCTICAADRPVGVVQPATGSRVQRSARLTSSVFAS